MFDKIKRPRYNSEPFAYNEQKLEAGKAECLLAVNFIKDSHLLSREDKLDRLHQRVSLNNRAIRKVHHISIGFSPKDKISSDLMQVIAKRYMKAICFDEQPYLVYRHHDTIQPHFHIVSPNIRPDGSQISISKARFHQTKELLKQWETEFSLTKSKRIKPEDELSYKVRQAQKVVYGKVPIKHAISDVLHTVIDQYKYTSLTEFNALLRLYNVRAERGSESSLCYRNKGLMYHVLDENGKEVGIPIKASDFLLKPTLPNLVQRFALNESLQLQYRQRATTAIDWTLAGDPPTGRASAKQWKKKGSASSCRPTKKAARKRFSL